MGRAKLNGQSGGNKINGIVEEYIVQSSNVSAGDFVEFVTTAPVAGTLYATNSIRTDTIQVALLNENSVIVGFHNSTNSYYYAQILLFSENDITIGIPTSIATAGINEFTVCRISDTKAVFIYHYYASQYNIRASVITITGATISVGSQQSLKSSSSALCYGFGSAGLSETQVIFTYGYNGSSQKFVILTLTGDTITYGTETSGGTFTNSGMKLQKISAGKYLACYRSGYSSDYPYIGIITVSGTTITFGTSVQVVTAYSKFCRATLLSETKGVCIYNKTASPYGFYAKVFTVSGTAITFGVEYTISTSSRGKYEIKAINGEKCLVAYMDNLNNYYPTSLFLTVNETAITISSPVVIATKTVSGSENNSDSFLHNGRMYYVFDDTNNSYYGQAVSILTGGYIKPSTSKYKISGIAKKKGIIGETIPVFTLV